MKKNNKEKREMYIMLMKKGGKAEVAAYNKSKRLSIASHPNQTIENKKNKREKYKPDYERNAALYY